ncbi:Actin family protein [Tritrichomonas foetus]|uniref:Actin family protein n=1 Tax=Tritrichomonas foetus TaxID=1144522 RepID=A0A1J4JE01_9EUKA|nr:Actin family protein [Tritrichomonas foetus]|eukprot:OHS97386.1 Actin family protein [Tritrichomonas foetus]
MEKNLKSSMNLLPCEANSLVYDFGSNSIQFGFAGDAQPLYSVPSAGCQRPHDGDIYLEFGNSWLQKKYNEIEIKPMIDDNGTLIDQNLLTSFFDWTYQSCLNVDSGNLPILVTQPSHLTKKPILYHKWRKEMCEAIFDFAGHPSLCLEHDSVLACFSRAAHTATVVDFGWSCIRIVPILEGQPLLNSMEISRIGGCQLCAKLHNYLMNSGHRNLTTHLEVPNYGYNIDNSYRPTNSQLQYCRQALLQDMIQSCLTFTPVPDPNYWVYCLPSREEINIKNEITFLMQELLNQQKQVPGPIQDYINLSINNKNTPADVRRQLWANIVTSGGFSQLPGFHTELEAQANRLKPSNYIARVIPPMHRLTGGSNTVWAGGSILASLDNFPEFCITKQEWEEVGANILQSKCL